MSPCLHLSLRRAARRTVFIAGASGVIGQVLCRLVVADGWDVVGTTRSPARAELLHAIGVRPVVVDVLDRPALADAVAAAAPDFVIHQLTDLPKTFSEAGLAAARQANARLREIGTSHLVDAAVAAGVRRIVVQSIAFAYAPGRRPFGEDHPLDVSQYASVVTLETLVCRASIEGVVLRYGRLYGPDTWSPDGPSGETPLHVDAAADAARLALTHGRPGIYNVAEDDGSVSIAKVIGELGWSAAFRAPRFDIPAVRGDHGTA